MIFLISIILNIPAGFIRHNSVLFLIPDQLLVLNKFHIKSLKIYLSGTFTTEAMEVCLYEQNVYCIEPGKVQVRTHQVKY